MKCARVRCVRVKRKNEIRALCLTHRRMCLANALTGALNCSYGANIECFKSRVPVNRNILEVTTDTQSNNNTTRRQNRTHTNMRPLEGQILKSISKEKNNTHAKTAYLKCRHYEPSTHPSSQPEQPKGRSTHTLKNLDLAGLDGDQGESPGSC